MSTARLSRRSSQPGARRLGRMRGCIAAMVDQHESDVGDLQLVSSIDAASVDGVARDTRAPTTTGCGHWPSSQNVRCAAVPTARAAVLRCSSSGRPGNESPCGRSLPAVPQELTAGGAAAVGREPVASSHGETSSFSTLLSRGWWPRLREPKSKAQHHIPRPFG